MFEREAHLQSLNCEMYFYIIPLSHDRQVSVSYSPWSPPHKYIVRSSSVLLVSEIKCYISCCSSSRCDRTAAAKAEALIGSTVNSVPAEVSQAGGGDKRLGFNRREKCGGGKRWRVSKTSVRCTSCDEADCWESWRFSQVLLSCCPVWLPRGCPGSWYRPLTSQNWLGNSYS